MIIGLPLSNIILQQKGLKFIQKLYIKNEVKCDSEWVYRFKKRHSLQKIKYLEEANSALLETFLEEYLKLQRLLSEYNKEDIYNADEIELFFRMESNQTLSTETIAGYKKVNL